MTRGKTARLVKSPRPFWTDPGLAVFLSGYYDENALGRSRELGYFFETLVLLHLRILAGLMIPRARLYNWRTRKGVEVDFVVEHGRRLLAIETKLTTAADFRKTSALRAFLKAHPEASGGLMIYGGARVRQLDERIFAVPWPMITG